MWNQLQTFFYQLKITYNLRKINGILMSWYQSMFGKNWELTLVKLKVRTWYLNLIQSKPHNYRNPNRKVLLISKEAGRWEESEYANQKFNKKDCVTSVRSLVIKKEYSKFKLGWLKKQWIKLCLAFCFVLSHIWWCSFEILWGINSWASIHSNSLQESSSKKKQD